jgi:hypothetical protein
MRIDIQRYLTNSYMGFAEAAIGGIAAGATSSLMNSGKGGTSGAVGRYYNQADQSWESARDQTEQNNDAMQRLAMPEYMKAYLASQGIDYTQFLQASDKAGDVYGGLAGLAGNQVGQFGQAADRASGEQQLMYGAGANLINTAQDPQNALYGRTVQQLTDQVRAGQAARGLGNSPVGAAEENQALGNFNIDWQNNQLQRQATAGTAAATMGNAGVGQGNLYTQDINAMFGAGNNQAQYYGQQAQTPLQAKQMVAGAPANTANSLLTNTNQLNSMYMNQANLDLPYMGLGQAGSQFNAQNAISNNAGIGKLFGQATGQFTNALSGWLGGNSAGSGNSGTSPYYGSNGQGWEATSGVGNYYDPNAGWNSGFTMTDIPTTGYYGP